MILQGTANGGGYAIAKAFVYKAPTFEIAQNKISSDQVEKHVEKFRNCKEELVKDLEDLRQSLRDKKPSEAMIFQAHVDMLNDPTLSTAIEQAICNDFYSGDAAIARIFQQFVDIFMASGNQITEERTKDLRDIESKLLSLWFEEPFNSLEEIDSPIILVAEDLLPSDTANLNTENVLGIVTEIGGSTSHTAILAKSLGIPAVLGVDDIVKKIIADETIILDAEKGEVVLAPSAEQIKEYSNLRDVNALKQEELEKYFCVLAKTPDGKRFEVMVNLGSSDDKAMDFTECVDGVGLFRSEFLYMESDTWPSEEEQYLNYKKVLENYPGKEVTIRTLDIGGDKKLSYTNLPEEQNPFLGLRALRLSFDNMPIFKTQLRALLRASVHGKLNIMFPMVGSIGDLRFAKKIVDEVKLELSLESLPYSDNVKLGIMVEIPSIAIMADVAAQECDFASIGTNDLCQYLTAADRLNSSVTQYYQTFHPAMFRIIKHTVDAFAKEGKPVSVCGEMASDPKATAPLLGLGVTKLSMNQASVAKVKNIICKIPYSRMERIAETVIELASAPQIETFLDSELELLI